MAKMNRLDYSLGKQVNNTDATSKHLIKITEDSLTLRH